jgi:ATP-dependent Lhr-like helicase
LRRCWSPRPGAGKTLAGFPADLCDLIEPPADGAAHALHLAAEGAGGRRPAQPADVPIEEMGLDIRVETRTGDTPSDRKARQRARPPQMLLTTPESLSLLLSYPDSFRCSPT